MCLLHCLEIIFFIIMSIFNFLQIKDLFQHVHNFNCSYCSLLGYDIIEPDRWVPTFWRFYCLCLQGCKCMHQVPSKCWVCCTTRLYGVVAQFTLWIAEFLMTESKKVKTGLIYSKSYVGSTNNGVAIKNVNLPEFAPRWFSVCLKQWQKCDMFKMLATMAEWQNAL